MPACTIVRIACEQQGQPRKFWSVVQGGGLKLSCESEAQFFVTHCEQEDRSCLIQHLQSGAFIEQAADRKLRLALCPASALPFSKLVAYSEGGRQVAQNSVWLRAATGGVVCSNAQDELAVAVNAMQDSSARECCFTFQTVDAQILLMQGLAPHLSDAYKADSPLKLHNPHSASVSIAAKPVAPCFTNRSPAMPIALKRPIRKVSFNDLSVMDQNESDHRSAPVHSPLPRKSGSFSHSYSLKDAFSNRIPHSPSCSNHSQGSDSEESKVRGGHLFDSDRMSSSDSLNNLEQSLSGLPVTPTTASSPCDTLSSSTQSHTTTHGLRSSQTAPGDLTPTANEVHDSSGQQLDQQDQRPGSQNKLGAAWGRTELLREPQKAYTEQQTDLAVVQSQLAASYDDERTSRGCKTHGGNLFMQGGMRSTQSTSALSSIPHRASPHRALKGHRTHGSQTALNFLSVNGSPSSPHRIPRALNHNQGFAQSAPVMGEGLLASEGDSLSHGQSRGWSHDPLLSSSSSSFSSKDCRRLIDSSEGLAVLRLNRVSGDSHQREPMLPCIYEGEPSQDNPETLQQLAAETLFSRCGPRGVVPPHNGTGPPVQLLRRTDTQWPQTGVPPCGSPCPIEVQPMKGRGNPGLGGRLFKGVKRISSSPDMQGSASLLHHPVIHKVTPRGSPSDAPSTPKRLHAQAQHCIC